MDVPPTSMPPVASKHNMSRMVIQHNYNPWNPQRSYKILDIDEDLGDMEGAEFKSLQKSRRAGANDFIVAKIKNKVGGWITTGAKYLVILLGQE